MEQNTCPSESPGKSDLDFSFHEDTFAFLELEVESSATGENIPQPEQINALAREF